jgi:tetratricopeptide (TPR) repeat protein
MKRVAPGLLLLCIVAAAAVPREQRERAYRENNRGVALLEQFQSVAAAEAFRKALALDATLGIARVNLAIALLTAPDLPGAEKEARAAVAALPDSPHAHYVLGLAARGLNQPEAAKQAFREVLSSDAADVGANVNLGQLLMQERSYAGAVAAFRAALASEAHNATAAYNLGLALARAGQTDEGQKMMERFRVLREGGYGTLIGQSYAEQGRYAEAIVSTGAEPELVDAATPDVRFADATAAALGVGSASGTGAVGRAALFDMDGDGDLDLFDVGASGQRLYLNEAGRFTDATKARGLDPAQGGVGAAAGDVDNDTRPDLLVLRAKGVSLYRAAEKALADVTTAAGLGSAGAASAAALADFDHDGDLDLLLGGASSADRLFQNAGDAKFKDIAAAASLTGAVHVTAAVATDFDNGRDIDLLEIPETGPPRLFRNLRDGRFREVAAEVGLGAAAGTRCVAVADFNKDTYSDFVFGADDGDLLALSDGKGRFALAPAPWRSAGSSTCLSLDYDNDGLADVLLGSRNGVRLLRGLGSRWSDATAALGAFAREPLTGAAAGDTDSDGDTDLLLRLASGRLLLLRNDGGSRRAAVSVRLAGLVSNRSGIGAKLELRAGSLRHKLETYAATPAAAASGALFGLGARESGEAVRVIWPSGTLQAELLATSPGRKLVTLEVKELNRKPSSCPYLYVWNGRAFEFVTDFMGGGEMGYLHAPGVFNHPDPDEYVRLSDAQLRPRGGRYELRVTNELEEALFVDKLALHEISHPADVEVYPHEGMTVPPKPHRLLALRRLRPPLRARDDAGRDVLERVLRTDRLYVEGFALAPIRGYAAEHALVLDLGAVPEQAALLLTGWTDYSWSSDNVAAAQAGLAARPPSLEVEDAHGRWTTAVEQIGIPVGRPQTVAVDLSGAWTSASRRVRIRTNMRIYWDQVRVGEIASGVVLEQAVLPLAGAVLRDRGFSAETSPDGREPYTYDYARVSRVSPWKTIPGVYTREGDVAELVADADDVFVIAKPGDEIALEFAAQASALPGGRRRTFLLHAVGFSKEMDINSATPDLLGPLPFRGMTRYPYAPPEAYPMSEERARLFEKYNTRVVRRPLPTLESAGAGASTRAGELRR